MANDLVILPFALPLPVKLLPPQIHAAHVHRQAFTP
jgi:hypothetical protein